MSTPEHDELRDIHRRIDALKEENERQFNSLTDKLHGLEVAVARGGRFPVGAYGAAVAILLAVGSGAFYTNQQLALLGHVATEAKRAIEHHVTAMGPAEQVVWKMDERLKNVEARIVGNTSEGWHRRDHDVYAESIRAEIKRLDTRIDSLTPRK
jgi:hypothetical protein